MELTIRCAKHPAQKLDAKIVCLASGAHTIEVEPCYECHTTDEWAGYQDGLHDRPRKRGGKKPNGDPHEA
jgi:hypothetical protein